MPTVEILIQEIKELKEEIRRDRCRQMMYILNFNYLGVKLLSGQRFTSYGDFLSWLKESDGWLVLHNAGFPYTDELDTEGLYAYLIERGYRKKD